MNNKSFTVTLDRLTEELEAFVKTMKGLIAMNKEHVETYPGDEYFKGKVDAYEVALHFFNVNMQRAHHAPRKKKVAVL